MNEESLRAFFNEKAGTWDGSRSEKDALKLEQMSALLNLKPGSAVLDAGTGTGVFLPYILDKIGDKGRVIALDFAENMLKQACVKNGNSNIHYLQADIMTIPIEDDMFDRVICYSSFPHFNDKLKAAKEIRRVMKRGGMLSICHTSSRTHINKVHSRHSAVMNDILPDAVEMRSMLAEAGFNSIQIEDTEDSYLATAEK
jgi:ubiquinone/menaquinone biosynthesis C-methylase UbiE